MDEFNKFKNNGTAPAETTAWVCMDVPLAILVRAHAASNCNVGLKNNYKWIIIIMNIIKMYFYPITNYSFNYYMILF